MSKFITIEGNIGVGKSTCLPAVAAELTRLTGEDWTVLQEPVDDPEFIRLHERFYKLGTPESRIEFQMYITNRRSNLVRGLPAHLNYVLERSLLSDLVFSHVNFRAAEVPEGKYLGYYYDIERRLRDYPKMSACAYIKASPRTCQKRMNKRARSGEEEIPLSYLKNIANFHKAVLEQVCPEEGIPLKRFDWQRGRVKEDGSIYVTDLAEWVVSVL